MGLNYDFIARTGALAPATAADGALFKAPRAVIELIPESMARENIILPIASHGETLTVAAADAGDVLLADKLSFVLNRKIKLVAYPQAAIIGAINHHYGHTETQSMESMLCEFTDTTVDFADPAAARRKARGLPVVGRAITEFQKGVKGLDDAAFALACDEAPSFGDHDSDSLSETGSTGRGFDSTPSQVRDGMFYLTLPDGQRVVVTDRHGRMTVVTGPARIWKWGNTIQKMSHYVAHPGEFLVVRYRDGRQENLAGPCEVWFDPRIHLSVHKQDALQIAMKEAVVVYSQAAAGVSRRIAHGPALYVPAPGEWLHTFTWHGSDGGSTGTQKTSKGLVFQKLWLMPDQMYHDVDEVRTADDAVLTIKLMIFFELLDIDRMLDTTHDPIGDFVNAATSDVVDFTGRKTFEEFKKETGRLNEMDTYRQLAVRAAQTGYRINKVVYRGYAAPDRLQAMHDQAIEARTKLELDRATEEQAQELEDFRLNAQMQRATKRRTEQATEVSAELELQRQRQEADLGQVKRSAELQQDIHRANDARQREHLESLKAMSVDLTAFLTQGRADRVIELRGGANGNGTHVHIDRLGEGA
ncbi:GspE/PulE/PilB domain-containing protein [Zavarzinella formosa]|uniref:GspE/PulE/PilB domain-containing protein n=1 Tax=Zavarzinella formosa TaxID=360055 RepID=UPI000316F8C8|nr:hypothetical protein [Zavarzinella formosa]